MNNNTTYKDSPLGKIPCDWEVKRIADYGKVFTENTPDFEIGKTKLLCNQLGYVSNGEHLQFNTKKTILI